MLGHITGPIVLVLVKIGVWGVVKDILRYPGGRCWITWWTAGKEKQKASSSRSVELGPLLTIPFHNNLEGAASQCLLASARLGNGVQLLDGNAPLGIPTCRPTPHTHLDRYWATSQP